MYAKDLDSTLQSMTQRMQQSIELERVGILMGVSKPNDWMKGLLEVEFIPIDSIKSEKVVLDTGSDLMQFGISIFGDRLVAHMSDVSHSIIDVGSRRFDDPRWDTSLKNASLSIAY